jgi:hypothetical protein
MEMQEKVDDATVNTSLQQSQFKDLKTSPSITS